MDGFRRLSLALARDESDRALLEHARLLYTACAPDELHVITVLSPSLLDACWPEDRQRIEAQLVTDVVDRMGPDVRKRLVTHVTRGPVLAELRRHIAADRIDLLLIGHHHGRRSRALARRIARTAPCSVWMLPDGASAGARMVVVPVDYSETAAHALDATLELCRALRIPECLVLNVYSGDDVAEPTILRDEVYEMERFLALRDTRDVRVTPLFESAPDVVTGIRRIVVRTGADLVSMGTKGHSRATSLLLGSATDDALEDLACPVLVVRAPGEPASLLRTLVRRIFTDEDRPRLS